MDGRAPGARSRHFNREEDRENIAALSTAGAEERDLGAGAGGAVESAAVGRRDGNQLEINIVFELVPRCVSLSVS